MGSLSFQKYTLFKLYGFISILILLFIFAQIAVAWYLNPVASELFFAISFILCFAISILYTCGMIFCKRLNAFFIIQRVPFSKYMNIAQVVSHRELKGLSCKDRYNRLIKSSKACFSTIEPGYYRTITHKAIIKRVANAGFTITNIPVDLGTHSMKSPVLDISGFACVLCKN